MAASKVCLVVGVGPGLGMACVRRWIGEGFKVAMVSRTASKLEQLAATTPGAFAFPADITDPASTKAALTTIEQQLGDIHTVVYNAGSGVFGTYMNVTHQQLDFSMATNVHGLLTVAQHLGPKMTSRGEGVFCVTGATAALRGKPMTVGFATAKAAQRMLTQSLARDLGPRGVHCFYVIVDGGIGKDSGDDGQNGSRMDPDAIAGTYWAVAQQPRNCWTQEMDVRPAVETW
jgi:NAD(P)-dependent dehydrogenase (short-subunit alcohol dehydrogenase family)